MCASLALNETAGRLAWDDHVLQNVMKKAHNRTGLLSAAVGPGGSFGEMAVLHVRNQTLGGLDAFAIEGRVANAALETAVAAAGTFDWGLAKHLNATLRSCATPSQPGGRTATGASRSSRPCPPRRT